MGFLVSLFLEMVSLLLLLAQLQPVAQRLKLQAPWGMATVELLTVFLLYWLFVHPSARHLCFIWNRSVEDVVFISGIRFIFVVLAFSVGGGRRLQRYVRLMVYVTYVLLVAM